MKFSSKMLPTVSTFGAVALLLVVASCGGGGSTSSPASGGTGSTSGTGGGGANQQPPTITASASLLDFGKVGIGSTDSKTLILKNTGAGQLSISGFTVSPAMFTITPIPLPVRLSAGQSVALSVNYAPAVVGNDGGTLTIKNDTSNPNLNVALLGAGQQQATWYIRQDGGTRQQCTGKVDAAYPGTGSTQACAFSNPYYLFTDDVTTTSFNWIIAGGDTVIIRNGSYRMGYKNNQNDIAGKWAGCAGDTFNCFMPAIPSGSAGKPTVFAGEGYSSGCPTKPELHGGYALNTVINLKGSSFVEVRCLEIDDHAFCARVGNAAPFCNANVPIDDFAKVGITTDNTTSDIKLADLYVHGFASRGIIGPIGGLIVAQNVRLAGNSGAGWDLDDGTGNVNGPNAAIQASQLLVEWNGCTELVAPSNFALPFTACSDGNNGGYGDGVGTPDTTMAFSCDQCTFRYNTQDGLDLLHTTGTQIQITHSTSYGNMGQQWKLGANQNVIFRNNVTVHNCKRLSAPITGTPSNFNAALTEFCRAAGDGFAFNLTPSSVYHIENNSYAGYGATTYDIGCSTSNCAGAQIFFINNLNIAYLQPGAAQLPGIFFLGTGVADTNFVQRSNNIYYNFRNCPISFPAELCLNPVVTNLPPFTSEAALDAIDLHLALGSIAIDTGLTIPAITDDFDRRSRPQGPGYDIGAYEK